MPPRLVEEMSTEERKQYEDWLEKQKPEPTGIERGTDGVYATCGKCGRRLAVLMCVKHGCVKFATGMPKWCPECGQRVQRWDLDG